MRPHFVSGFRPKMIPLNRMIGFLLGAPQSEFRQSQIAGMIDRRGR